MTQPPDGYPHDPQPDPHAYEPPAPDRGGAPPRSGRPGQGLVIAGVALVGALLLSGTLLAAWLLATTDRDGAAAPTDAVDAFLTAVYHDRDAAEAAALVCAEARDDDALATQIDGIRAYDAQYPEPRFTWSHPEVVDETGEVTVVAVTVTMITVDERVADQELRVAVLDKDPHGWWVCNVDSVPDVEPDDPDDPDVDEDDADGE